MEPLKNNTGYNALIQNIITEFNRLANSWGETNGYTKSPHSKSITIDDWNTFISLMQQTLYYVMATRSALLQLEEVGNALEQYVSVSEVSISDEGILSLLFGSGNIKDATGALPRVRIDNLFWQYTIDGGNNWKPLNARAMPYLKIEEGDWYISFDETNWTYAGPAQGPRGLGFDISKTYASVEEMYDRFDTDDVPLNGLALISTDVDHEDNAKIYVKTESNYRYLIDLSGAQGIRGEKGATPVRGTDYWTPDDKSEIINDVLHSLPVAEEASF